VIVTEFALPWNYTLWEKTAGTAQPGLELGAAAPTAPPSRLNAAAAASNLAPPPARSGTEGLHAQAAARPASARDRDTTGDTASERRSSTPSHRGGTTEHRGTPAEPLDCGRSAFSLGGEAQQRAEPPRRHHGAPRHPAAGRHVTAGRQVPAPAAAAALFSTPRRRADATTRQVAAPPRRIRVNCLKMGASLLGREGATTSASLPRGSPRRPTA